MHAFITSTGLVTLSEIGDKTQLLALLLATRFQKSFPIILGILVATLANHTLAAWAGEWIAGALGEQRLRWILGGLFMAMAVWVLVPDKMDEKEAVLTGTGSAFFITVVTFFLAEIGDKTQLATAALGAQYHALIPVVAGTTLGMMIADVPAVLGGHKLAGRLNLTYVRALAAALFLGVGLAALFGLGE